MLVDSGIIMNTIYCSTMLSEITVVYKSTSFYAELIDSDSCVIFWAYSFCFHNMSVFLSVLSSLVAVDILFK